MHFLHAMKRALGRSLEDDVFGIAKAGAYSAILTLFPAMMVLAAVIAASNTTQAFLEQISYAVGHILPSGTSQTVMAYFHTPGRPVGLLVTTSLVTVWTASGVTITWMEGFRYAYQLPKSWGMVHERLIAILMVFLALLPMAFASALLAFGNQIENWMLFHSIREVSPYITLLWRGIRWLTAAVTSVAVVALIYHFGVPRTQPWHTVLPGATLATAIWFPATLLFGWYLTHVAEYSLIYGSLGVPIALLVWMYIVSLIVLFGAEVNALLYPRSLAASKGN